MQDYYDPIDEHFFEMVESAHLANMEKRLKTNQGEVASWRDIEYVLNHIPNHPKALWYLIRFSREFKDYKPQDADVFFEKAIQWSPEEPNTRVLYGLHLQKYPKLKEVIEQYNIALKYDPNHVEAHYNLGLALLEAGDIDSAKLHAKKAYELGYPLPGLREKLKKLNAWP